jgi:hypothetical protein
MEVEKAQAIAKILSDIETIEKKIERFNNTKEWCKIDFRGEDGTEREFMFTLSTEDTKDKLMVRDIRYFVADSLSKRLNNLLERLASY